MDRQKHVILFPFDHLLPQELLLALVQQQGEIEIWTDLESPASHAPAQFKKTDLNQTQVFFPDQAFEQVNTIWFCPILWAHHLYYFEELDEARYLERLEICLKIMRSLVRHVIEKEKPQTILCLNSYEVYDPTSNTKALETQRTGSSPIAKKLSEIESEIDVLKPSGIRILKVRLGEILHYQKGFLPKVHQHIYTESIPFEGPDAGREWISWIHYTDAINGLLLLQQNPKFQGNLNLVAKTNLRFNDLFSFLENRYKMKQIHYEKKGLFKKTIYPMINQQLSSQFTQISFQFNQFDAAWDNLITKDLQDRNVLIFYNFLWLSANKQDIFTHILAKKIYLKSLPFLKQLSVTEGPIEDLQKGSSFVVETKRLGMIHNIKLFFSHFDHQQHLYTFVQKKGPFEFWNHQFSLSTIGEKTFLFERFLMKMPEWELKTPFYKNYTEEVEENLKIRRELISKGGS